jgi:general L-amino acid transport system permease protein
MASQNQIPPVAQITPLQWLKQNLFSSWFNGILTVICLGSICQSVSSFMVWALTQADWTVLRANLRLFFVGRYPIEHYWRIWSALALVAGLGGMSWGIWDRFNRTTAIAIGSTTVALAILMPVDLLSKFWILSVGAAIFAGLWLGKQTKFFGTWLGWLWLLALSVVLWLIGGGLGLARVDINLWNGLLLTMLLAVVSIAISFPLGVLLALGRQSSLPLVRWSCTLYIELVRGLPLIGILFIAQVMLPLVLPPNVRIERVIRAIAGFILFSSAYLAETVRGGLQSVPQGQTEAGRALGLSTPLILMLIVLPQALRAAIPAIVGQFISLFKDTALVTVVGLVDLMGISRSVLSQPDFLGSYAEVYCFIGAIYWVCTYSMSLLSRRIEKALNHN